MSFALFTDNAANLPLRLIQAENVGVIPFSYYLEGKEYKDTDIEAFDGHAFYQKMMDGAIVTTSQINPSAFEENFRAALEKGLDVVHVSMSSGISGAYASSLIAIDELRDEFPERTIRSIDTRCASLGEGHFAIWALECREKGMSAKETADFIESKLDNMVQIFTVEDLVYLKRSGRISNFKATMATILNIKPLLKGNENGQIINFGTFRGLKKSLRALADLYEEYALNRENEKVYISHANCEEDADMLIEMIKEKNNPKEFIKVMFEPVTGSHVGPGALALFFMGPDDNRTKIQ